MNECAFIFFKFIIHDSQLLFNKKAVRFEA